MSEKLGQETQPKEEVREETAYISGEYLSAACNMVAWQFIDAPPGEEPKDVEEFAERSGYMLRQHAPVAYSYFFQNHAGETALPTGTLDIIMGYVRKERPDFLGGDVRGKIILP